MNGEPVAPGRLVALAGPMPLDPIMNPAFELLARTAADSVGRGVEAGPWTCRTTSRASSSTPGRSGVFSCTTSDSAIRRRGRWSTASGSTQARAALLSALFDREPPTPPTAAIVSLLHAVDGLGALLSLNDRGWRWVHMRASEIASGSWVDEYETALPEMNLAVTASAMRQALA